MRLSVDRGDAHSQQSNWYAISFCIPQQSDGRVYEVFKILEAIKEASASGYLTEIIIFDFDCDGFTRDTLLDE